MRYNVADPIQLNILTSVVGVVCERRGLTDISDREEVSGQVMSLFTQGITNRTELLHRMGVVAPIAPEMNDNLRA